MLECWLKEHRFVSFLDWEHIHPFLAKQLVGVQDVEVQVVDDAVCSHGVVANPQLGLVWDLEQLEQEDHQLIWQHLGKSLFSEQEKQGVVLADWVLIEKHGLKFTVNLCIVVLLTIFGLFLFFWYDVFIVQINVEENALLVFCKNVRVSTTSFENAKSVF